MSCNIQSFSDELRHAFFQTAFTAYCCVFKEITFVGSNQRNYFENAHACSKRSLKTRVATSLKWGQCVRVLVLRRRAGSIPTHNCLQSSGFFCELFHSLPYCTLQSFFNLIKVVELIKNESNSTESVKIVQSNL